MLRPDWWGGEKPGFWGPGGVARNRVSMTFVCWWLSMV